VARRLPLGAAESRFLGRSFGERHRSARPLDSRREAAQLALILLVALCLIVAGSVGAVRAAIDLADRWSVPQALVGTLVLAVLTALPNAWTGIRFGLQHRGSALPAALGALTVFSRLDIFGLVWLLGMTAAALALFGKPRGGGRSAGAFLIVLYAVFVVVQIAANV
jgi:Ca2+/Na+ antiporter